MVRSISIVALATSYALSATAANLPALVERQNQAPALDDPAILNFALTLEHLEATFYVQALKNYSDSDFEKAGFPGIRDKIESISADESQHVDFLTSALKAAGGNPVGASTYQFPSTDVKSFLGLAQIVEGVGVSAYLGASTAITNKAYLGAAASILTVEARHNAFLRYVNGQSPFPSPEDGALSPRSVVSLAAGFFAPGAQNAPAIQPFPALTVKAGNESTIGSSITVTFANSSSDSLFCSFISGVTAAFSPYQKDNTSCVIPSQNVTAGQTYVLITSAQSVTDGTTLAGPAIIDIGDAVTSVNAVANPGMSSNTSTGSGSHGGSSSSSAGRVAGFPKVAGALALVAGFVCLF